MPNAILEADESQPTNVAPEEGKLEKAVEAEQETVKPEGEKQPEVQETETPPEQAPAEPTIEIDGQQVPLSRAKEALDRYANDEKWTAKNTQRAQELSAKEKELQQKLYLAEMVERRPELLSKLFAPEQVRDIDSELNQLYGQKPTDLFSQEYANWELKKDMLLSERAETRALQKAQAEAAKTVALEHNSQVEKSAWEKYQSKGVKWDEFQDMAKWILQNVKESGGKYPSNSFDVAYKELFFDRALREAKLEGSRKVTESITQAQPARGSSGVQKKPENQTPEEEDDEAFIQEAKRYAPKK